MKVVSCNVRFQLLLLTIVFVVQLLMPSAIKISIPKKYDVVKLTIQHQNDKGHGVGVVGDTEVLVSSALPGEAVSVKLLRVNSVKRKETESSIKHVAFGKVISIQKSAIDRISAPCSLADRCGGCQIQHQEYGSQLKFKKALVVNCLRSSKVSSTAADKVSDVIPAEQQFFYRNKLQFALQRKANGRVALGLYASNSNQIIDTDSCRIQHPTTNRVLSQVKDLFDKYPQLSVYDENLKSGSLCHLVIRIGFATNEVMVCFVSSTRDVSGLSNISRFLARDNDNIKSILLNYNPNHNVEVINADPKATTVLHGSSAIFDEVATVKVTVSLLSFMQSNPLQVKTLYDTVKNCVLTILEKKRASVSTSKRLLWDLYCGVGTIGMYIATTTDIDAVIGVESCEPAAADAKKNAVTNKIDNISIYHGKAEEVVLNSTLIDGKSISPEDIVVINPPRKGCHTSLLKALISCGVTDLIYVSCNPKTLAKDLEILTDAGTSKSHFSIKSIQPVDMFPQISHVETVVWMTKDLCS